MAMLLRFRDFSGGLNLRDASGELAPNESPDMWNVTLDERGSVGKRLGYLKDGAMSAFAANIVNLFYSHHLGQMIVQEGVNVRRRTGLGTFSLVKAFSTNARVTFCDFNGKLLMLHPVDGLFSTADGASVSARIHTHEGVDIAVFQNKVWVAVGAALAAEQTRVYFSAVGDETNWTTAGAGSVDLREVDDSPLTALCGDSGQDIAGRGGLNVFKLTSSYRIHDSSTGAFVTIDPDTGAPGALCCAGIPGMLGGDATAVVNENGIFVTTGTGKLEKVSGKIDPLFTLAQLSLAGRDAFCSVAMPNGHLLFGLRRAGSTTNDLTVEYAPEAGWFAPYSFGASTFAVHGTTGQLYHGDPGTDRFLYETFVGGDDNGAAISARFQTRWEHPVPSEAVRVQRVQVFGRGMFSFGITINHEISAGIAYDFHGQSDAGVWGTFVWGAGVWGPGIYEHHQDFWPRITAHAVGFTANETSTDSATRPPILGGASPEVGAFGLFEITADLEPIGLN